MDKKLDKILAEISAGELIDKITILEIKKEKINDSEKLKDIDKELLSLSETFKKFISDPSKIASLIDRLKAINIKLWNIENAKRLAGGLCQLCNQKALFTNSKGAPFLEAHHIVLVNYDDINWSSSRFIYELLNSF